MWACKIVSTPDPDLPPPINLGTGRKLSSEPPAYLRVGIMILTCQSGGRGEPRPSPAQHKPGSELMLLCAPCPQRQSSDMSLPQLRTERKKPATLSFVFISVRGDGWFSPTTSEFKPKIVDLLKNVKDSVFDLLGTQQWMGIYANKKNPKNWKSFQESEVQS